MMTFQTNTQGQGHEGFSNYIIIADTLWVLSSYDSATKDGKSKYLANISR